jgi:hypothetical protein
LHGLLFALTGALAGIAAVVWWVPPSLVRHQPPRGGA